MALTEEQIKNLKPGDIVNIWGLVNLPLCDGNILVELRYEFDNRILPAYKKISTEFISMPCEPDGKPKYDPCRKFKKGDKATPRPINGRKLTKLPENIIVTVTSDEDDFGAVNIEYNSPNIAGVKTSTSVMAVFLELVTPVEELEPYMVDECGFAPTLYVRKNGKVYMTIPYKEGSSLFQTREEALAAAEAERDRLNAEYRKGQNE